MSHVRTNSSCLRMISGGEQRSASHTRIVSPLDPKVMYVAPIGREEEGGISYQGTEFYIWAVLEKLRDLMFSLTLLGRNRVTQ